MASARAQHQILRVYTKDGFPIVVQRFDSPTAPRAVVVLACATGVHARFYRKFAGWLSAQGVATCTFDYRYCGLSFPLSYNADAFTEEQRHDAVVAAPRDINLTETWGRQDLAAVIRYASDTWAGVPLTLLGHSMGAHLMTVVPDEWHRVTRFLNVNGGNASWENAVDPEVARYSLDTFIRELLETEGVFRASYLKLGYDLPYGPGLEWIEWFLHTHFSLAKKSDVENVRRLQGIPYLAIGFADDETVSKRMLERHLGLFSHVDGLKTSLYINPSTHNPPWPPCGHVNSFQHATKRTPHAPLATGATPNAGSVQSGRTRAETIWRVYLRWILDGEVDANAGEVRRWKVEDELDVHAEREQHERRERARKSVLAERNERVSAKL
ncbi:alpha/beta-hydrolase [Artomyces pyxidatus]|uniref:Alpha/beta-hydrolase n=1 Tax=Artomyces pyxidatus TaxID=48021 RepID=A0ACB8SZJ4_9AGAM|nr:alpha/beta-hydrolase [Artomyces pyxidatus]